MPTLFEVRGFRIFFWSNEGNPLEPAHVHVERASAAAKFWLVPEVALARAWGFNNGELKEIESILRARRQDLVRRWNEYFGIG